MVTNVDLVKSQIRIALGDKLDSVLRGTPAPAGHAIECRINAEHPEKFTPSAGKIKVFNPPGGTGVRIDTAAYAEATIPPYYDSLIAKLVTRGRAGHVHRGRHPHHDPAAQAHCRASRLPLRQLRYKVHGKAAGAKREITARFCHETLIPSARLTYYAAQLMIAVGVASTQRRLSATA
jgi:hypothetical protein